ncbi:MAG: trypsin-like peptidase domain-containing protein [Planctomycetes bacterium]|nr:trypsin-like peptidase domain-containing protein [Planctomycetota bacterium]
MRNLLIVFCAVLVLGLAGFNLRDMRLRVEQLETTPRVEPSSVRALDRELEELSARVGASLAALEALACEQERTASWGRRLAELQCELEVASANIDEHRARLTQWDLVRDEIGPDAVDARVATLRKSLSDEYRGLDVNVQRALDTAQKASTGVVTLTKSLERDRERMWNDLLGPTVQLMGEETVGSGVLLASEQVEGTADFTTYVITAWHVIRDIQAAPDSIHTPVPVTIYSRTGEIRSETAQLLKYDPTLDIALLRLNSSKPVDCGAKLAARERLNEVSIFEQVYAVGCPLGNDPIPTFGEIADTRHAVDGQHYWMISAPTYIGNSGGGIFDAETHELLGIFTKIYTHGSLRPTVVPHMGLATPLPAIYDWLDQVGYAKLEPKDASRTRTAAATR